MTRCEAWTDKVVTLQDLGDSERTQLLRHLANCEKCRREISQQETLLDAITQLEQPVIGDEKLLRYAVQRARPRETDFDGERCSPLQLRTIERTIAQKPQYQARVKQLNDELAEIDEFLLKAGIPDISLGQSSRPQRWLQTVESFAGEIRKPVMWTHPRLAQLAMGLAVILLFLFLPWSLRTDNPFYDKALIAHSEFSFITRGEANQDLLQAYSLFHAGQLSDAIDRLQVLAESASDAQVVTQARYALGISYLLRSKQDFLWVARNFKVEDVMAGIGHLTAALALSDMPGFRENCYWYLGKANLMLGDGDAATRAFQKVREFKGRRLGDAEKILNEPGQ